MKASPPAQTPGELRLSHSGATPLDASQQNLPANLPDGSLGDIAADRLDVRFTPEAEHRRVRQGCPLCQLAKYELAQKEAAN
jgi:hypothetical protein